MGKTGVLLVHGLGGTIYELGALPAQLKNAGFEVYAVNLRGHGARPEALAHVVLEDWLADVVAAYEDAKKQSETVHILGMCMGALLACELAKRQDDPQLGKLVMLAPTLFLDSWRVPWYHWLRHLHYLFPWARARYRIYEEDPYGIKNERLRAIVKKRLERGSDFHYAWIPLQSLWQLDRLRRLVLRDLSKVACPTLIVHPKQDEFSRVKSAWTLQQGVGKEKSQVVILNNSYHMVCIDNQRDAVVAEVLRFYGVIPHGT